MVRPSVGLTEHELLIMQILWESPTPLTVQALLNLFPRQPKPAYTSLLTAVRALEKKGVLNHEKQGRSHRYYPLLKRDRYQQSALKRLLANVFNNDALDLTVNLVKSEALSDDDIAKLKALVNEL